jgi:hypothetical protein
MSKTKKAKETNFSLIREKEIGKKISVLFLSFYTLNFSLEYV